MRYSPNHVIYVRKYLEVCVTICTSCQHSHNHFKSKVLIPYWVNDNDWSKYEQITLVGMITVPLPTICCWLVQILLECVKVICFLSSTTFASARWCKSKSKEFSNLKQEKLTEFLNLGKNSFVFSNWIWKTCTNKM